MLQKDIKKRLLETKEKKEKLLINQLRNTRPFNLNWPTWQHKLMLQD